MSELSVRAEPVFMTADRMNGRSVEALSETFRAMRQDDAHPQLRNAFADAINLGPNGADYRDMQSKGRLLVGGSCVRRSGDFVDWPYDAVLLAEGHDRTSDNSFSLVRMGLWVRKAKDERESDVEFSRLGEDLIRSSLTVPEPNQALPVFGLPVSRMTVIEDLDGRNGYVFGHKRDIEEIRSMQHVPHELKTLLVNKATAYHIREAKDYGSEAARRVYA